MIRYFVSRTKSSLTQHAWYWAWWLSVLVHAMVVSGLFLVWFHSIDQPRATTFESLQIDGGFSRPSEREIQEVVLPTPLEGQERSGLLQDIQMQIKQAQARGDQDNFERLNQLSSDLRRNSTTKTVDEMAEFFGGVFGSRATVPDPQKADQEFDVATAQMHDISKSTNELGVVSYTLMMVDAKGVSRQVEIDQQNGERLYKTMQLIKSNPLLEKVYRNILMGVLDQVLKEKPSQQDIQ
jgi:hypothetical protein